MPAHPAASAQTESKLASRHVSYTFEPNLDVKQIRDVEGNQVRLSKHRAPKEIVDRYAEQMKAGAIFPAVVVNERYEIVDGNSRWLATKRVKRDTIAAYVCYDLTALQARSLSVELNQSHGLSMTEEEVRGFVAGAIEEGQILDVKAYARITGIKPSRLARWVAVWHFDVRADKAGLANDRLEFLPDNVRAALNVARLEAVFVQATMLAADARAPAAQIKTVVTEANAARSEADALAVVARARAIRSEDIRRIASGFKKPPRKSKGAAVHMSGLLRYEVADLLDVSPDRQAETFKRMSCLEERLHEALARALAEWNLSVSSADRSVSPSIDLMHVG